VIGIDEIAIRKGHTYRIVVSDLRRGRPIWFGGDRALTVCQSSASSFATSAIEACRQRRPTK
jgi:hypothetical protein